VPWTSTEGGRGLAVGSMPHSSLGRRHGTAGRMICDGPALFAAETIVLS